jgi:hypothetical protein
MELRRTAHPGMFDAYYIDRASGKYTRSIETPSLREKSRLMNTGSCLKQEQPLFRMF